MIEGVQNACRQIGEYGASACTKVSEMGGRAISWIAEAARTIAEKLQEFAKTTLFPALQRLWACLTSLGRSTADAVKANPKEFVVVASAVGAGALAVGAAAGFGISKVMSGKAETPPPGGNPLPAGGADGEAAPV